MFSNTYIIISSYFLKLQVICFFRGSLLVSIILVVEINCLSLILLGLVGCNVRMFCSSLIAEVLSEVGTRDNS
jgi:hypothetical protein